eukprot:tig00000663_g2997.t1
MAAACLESGAVRWSELRGRTSSAVLHEGLRSAGAVLERQLAEIIASERGSVDWERERATYHQLRVRAMNSAGVAVQPSDEELLQFLTEELAREIRAERELLQYEDTEAFEEADAQSQLAHIPPDAECGHADTEMVEAWEDPARQRAESSQTCVCPVCRRAPVLQVDDGLRCPQLCGFESRTGVSPAQLASSLAMASAAHRTDCTGTLSCFCVPHVGLHMLCSVCDFEAPVL